MIPDNFFCKLKASNQEKLEQKRAGDPRGYYPIQMNATPLSKLLLYHRCEIDGWEIMSWAAEADADSIEDKDALRSLRNLDEFFATGHHKTVEELLFRLLPQADRRPIGELLIMDALDRCRRNELSSADFVSFFVDTYINIIEEMAEVCSPWITRLYDENNGFGFLELEQMRPQELLSYIEGLRNG